MGIDHTDGNDGMGLVQDEVGMLKRGLQLCKSLKPRQIKWDKGYLLADEKIDGMRAVMYWNEAEGTWEARSRNDKPMYNIDHIIAELNAWHVKDVVLDGEMFAVDFGTTLSYCRSQKPKADAAEKVVFIVFDMVRRDEWLAGTFVDSQQSRKDAIKFSLCDMKTIVPLLGYKVDSAEALDELFNETIAKGFEGLVLKDPTAPYCFKRSKGWAKYKPTTTGEFKIVGYEEGTNRLTGSLGAIVVQLNGVTGKVGTGFTDDQRESIWGRRNEFLGLWCEIEYETLVRSEKLRFPRFKGIRDAVGGDHILLGS